MGDIQESSTTVRKMPVTSRTHKEPRCQSCKANTSRCCAALKKHLWDDRTHIERGLIILVAFFALAIFCLAITVHVLSNQVYESIMLSDICITKDCINTASHILNRMDSNVEPCSNFYQFACGKFLEDSFVAEVDEESTEPSSEGVNMFTINQDIFNARIMNVLEVTNYSDPKSLWIARTYFQSCMDEDRIERLGLEPLVNLIDVLGGWPVLDSLWDDEGFAWAEMLNRLSTNGLDSSLFFSVNLMPDEKGIHNHIFMLDEPFTNVPNELEDHLPRTALLDTRTISYFHFMVNVSVLFGANRTIAEQELKKVLDFEAMLLKTKLRSASSPDTSKTFSLSNLNRLITGFDWMSYFGKLLPFKITGKEQVYVSNTQYFKNVFSEIKKTPNRVLANFMMWRIVKDNLDYLSLQAREVALLFEHTTECGEPTVPRWLRCLSHVWEDMVSPAAVYIRRFLSPEVKAKVEEVFKGIHNELLESISYYKYIEDAEREEALEIIQGINHFVFPDELMDDGELDRYYEQLSFNKDEYFQNVLKMKKFLRDAKLSNFLNPPDAPHWGNVRYQIKLGKKQRPTLEESVELPFTLLVGLSFHAERPQYANFASIGTMIGQSLISKLTPEIQDVLFPEKDKCTDIQISNPLVESLEGGNIEIIQAMRLAYKAYQRWVDANDEEKTLPGLYYNPKQLFWIMEASVVCGRYPEMSDSHQFVKARINGPLSNLVEFSDDFECPAESGMNPEERCAVW